MRVALLIRALGRGGAERQMVTLAGALTVRGHDVHVLSFHGHGELIPELRAAGVQVWSANKRGRWDLPGFAVRLTRRLRQIQPEVLYSSMPAANIMGCVARRCLAPRPALVWRLASSQMDLTAYDRFSALSYTVEKLCAAVPAVIVANSHAGREAARRRGFAAAKLRVVWNGIDTRAFAPARERGAGLKRKLGLDAGKWTIGQVARGDPKKAYEDFLDAARLLCERRDDVQFLCVGVEPGLYASRLRERAENHGIREQVFWHRMERDMPAVYNALDINTLASRFGEGCPNAVGEAMACGVPCVVSDVGDSRLLVGATGEVVPPGSPQALMQAWLRLLDGGAETMVVLGSAARQRVIQHLSVDHYVSETEALLCSAGRCAA